MPQSPYSTKILEYFSRAACIFLRTASGIFSGRLCSFAGKQVKCIFLSAFCLIIVITSRASAPQAIIRTFGLSLGKITLQTRHYACAS